MDPQRVTRIERAREHLLALYHPSCRLCRIRCGANRQEGELGACGLADATPIYRRQLHLGEELPLVPSYAIWLAGCNFACEFCSDAQAIRPPLPGRSLPARELARAVAGDLARIQVPVKNLNFVGGEPSISLPYLADFALALLESGTPVPPLLLNTNGFLTREAASTAVDLFDVFVVDFKFSNDRCAAGLGAATPYVEAILATLRHWMASGREVWVRHLLVPGHVDCCTRGVIELVQREVPHVRLNLMPAFVAFREGWRSLESAERQAARSLLEKAAIEQKYWDGSPLT